MEDEDAEEDGAHGADARPDWVGGAYGQGLGGFGEEHGAEDVEEGEARHPLPVGEAGEAFGLAEAEGEAHFAEAGDDEYYPVHVLGVFVVHKGGRPPSEWPPCGLLCGVFISRG